MDLWCKKITHTHLFPNSDFIAPLWLMEILDWPTDEMAIVQSAGKQFTFYVSCVHYRYQLNVLAVIIQPLNDLIFVFYIFVTNRFLPHTLTITKILRWIFHSDPGAGIIQLIFKNSSLMSNEMNRQYTSFANRFRRYGFCTRWARCAVV